MIFEHLPPLLLKEGRRIKFVKVPLKLSSLEMIAGIEKIGRGVDHGSDAGVVDVDVGDNAKAEEGGIGSYQSLLLRRGRNRRGSNSTLISCSSSMAAAASSSSFLSAAANWEGLFTEKSKKKSLFVCQRRPI